MFRTALLVLALATAGGAPYLDRFLDLIGAGTSLDPDHAADNGDAGGHFDPNG